MALRNVQVEVSTEQYTSRITKLRLRTNGMYIKLETGKEHFILIDKVTPYIDTLRYVTQERIGCPYRWRRVFYPDDWGEPQYFVDLDGLRTITRALRGQCAPSS